MPNVLIVDDDPDSCEFVARFLQKHGYGTRCVPNGREALTHLLRNGIEALVLDVRMPEMDGISLLKVLRSYLRWHALPVFVVTAHATPQELQEARDLGVSTIFKKSAFKLVDLLESLRKVIPPQASAGSA